MPNKSYEYIGSELEIFSTANNWRAYWQSFVRPYLGNRVLEVGAGIGTIVQSLISEEIKSWTALEPDPSLFSQLEKTLKLQASLGSLNAYCGTLDNLDPADRFNSIIYIDVLEHIKNDQDELAKAETHLENNGYLIILVPAHQYLYSAFDKAIGHFRRYDKQSLQLIIPRELKLKKLIYLDSVGLFASLANRLLLKASNPSHLQIQFWDKWMVPISRLVDRVLGFKIGKSLLAIYAK